MDLLAASTLQQLEVTAGKVLTNKVTVPFM
jgi:hypothetical protein